MGIEPYILIAPSRAAAVRLRRRLASQGQALAGVYAMRLDELAGKIAEPALLLRGLKPWDWGLSVRIARQALDRTPLLPADSPLPRGPIARVLARTLSDLRAAGVTPKEFEACVSALAPAEEDRTRLTRLVALYQHFHLAIQDRFADPTQMMRGAIDGLSKADWLKDLPVWITDDLALTKVAQEFVVALAQHAVVRRIEYPPRAQERNAPAWHAHVPATRVDESPFQSLHAAEVPPCAGLVRLVHQIFEPQLRPDARDESVAFVSAATEAAEAMSIVRRLLREAERGVLWDEMGILLPRGDQALPLYCDLLARLGIPYALHSPLPLGRTRPARALRLLLRCRGLAREAVLEFLSSAPIPFETLLGSDARVSLSLWDTLGRETGIIAGQLHWMLALRSCVTRLGAEAERSDEETEAARLRAKSAAAEDLLRLIELLTPILDGLAGRASWFEWADRLRHAFAQWIMPGEDEIGIQEWQKVREVIADLAGQDDTAAMASFDEVEEVLSARLDDEACPRPRTETGALHIGELKDMRGLALRVIAIPGLAEGHYPGLFRPDPLLLDAERERLAIALTGLHKTRGAARASTERAPTQLSLFDDSSIEPAIATRDWLPTVQDRLDQARREFAQAIAQASERLILSYARTDARSGRARLPSFFFTAAAAAWTGRPLDRTELALLVEEERTDQLSLDDALDSGERDQWRMERGGPGAAAAIAAAHPLFEQGRRAHLARLSRSFTTHDGQIVLPADLRGRIDPSASDRPLSASRLSVYLRCGYKYLLQHILRLDAPCEPDERAEMTARERGSLFHEVAERFLRALRDTDGGPVRDNEKQRALLARIVAEALARRGETRWPRFPMLVEIEARGFLAEIENWFEREAQAEEPSRPLYFEVPFGMGDPSSPTDPALLEPLRVALPNGAHLHFRGLIDRIDRRADGSLSVRDYKTGKYRAVEAGTVHAERDLQIPIYVEAVRRMFPDARVGEAFLDYVHDGKTVPVDPEKVSAESLARVLARIVSAMAAGAFVPEPGACDTCEHTLFCGSPNLLRWRREHKQDDPLLGLYRAAQERP
ncbi:MAG: exodeoxyribonuclease V subunit gamma [Vicinamibacteria bacterium]|nr:exodeoxyribonuclease V subunit gamma [Vicinamibacteria bacterium]